MRSYFNFGKLLWILSFATIAFVSFNFGVAEGKTDSEPLPQIIKSVPIEDYINFAGEAAPIHKFDVKERLDRELLVNSYWQSNTVQHLKLSTRYMPVIQKILAEQGVPDDFKYLAIAESDLRMKTSSAGAKGLWQLMKGTAKDLGLEVNSEVDERYHVEKSTLAACKYIKRLKERFGSWTDAAAAYNVGPTNYSKILSRQQESSYYKLNLNDETSRYVFRILAYKYIHSNPEKYGFYIYPDERYRPLDDYFEITIDKTVSNWSAITKKHGISYRDLKVYNPWLMDNKLTVIKNVYQVKIPKK